jgi:signal transduction histidine kinase
MQSLKEAVRIFNIFLLGTAAVSMVIIIIMTYFMSKRFVEPIRNMNSVTKKIAQLNFSDKCFINTKDELEELGNNINALSGSLESTIGDLKDELEKTKKLEELRKRFVSTVSHELKTPISLMQGYSIGLSSDVCEEKERRDYYAQVIAEEAERLGLLVNELMDLTQLEAGYITLNEVDFELKDFLIETIEKFQAAHPDIHMEFKGPDEELWCYADVMHMDRVIGNYLSNAVRHVNEEKHVVVEVELKKDYYNVKVKNSGSHIPEDKIQDIWNSFYRVDEARNRADGGHGLGLSIVKNIQGAHGMPYGVENVKGGVEFSFGVKKGESPDDL